MVLFTLAALVLLVSGLEGQPPRDPLCTESRECRQLALAAAERREYETFHDLAWRAVQTGAPNDPALMYLLARAQALSGRAHDALIMLTRMADVGVPSDAATNEEFARTRQLPGWPDLQARLERLGHSDSPPAVAIAGSTPPPALTTSASAVTPAPLGEAVRFSTERFAVGGLAYDAVSGRFVVGDRHGRKLLVARDGADRVQDLVRADSAGFHEISAVEIDRKRGDLWVASGPAADGAGTLHRLQLVSGRPLKAFPVAADGEPVELVDLAVTAAGAVLVLESASRQVLLLRPGAAALEPVLRLTVEDPASVTTGSDERIAYVAHRDGVARIDLQARRMTRVAAPKGIRLAGIDRIRAYRQALIAVQPDAAGVPRCVRLELNANGRAVTRARRIDAPVPAGGQTFVTVSGDELVYLAGPSSAGPPEFTAYRVRLR